MITILLTSAGMQVKDEILKILPKPPQEIKLAHIITASKGEKDTSYVQHEEAEMKKLGFQVENIDLEDKTADELRELFADKDIVYVQGGNTFYLLYHVKRSGFDEVIQEFIKRGGIYIGVSAGSIIACPTIEVANWGSIDSNDVGITDLSAMDLVGFLIYPHYTPDQEDIILEEHDNTFLPVTVITDDQAVLVQNEEVTLVGKGEQVVL